MTLREMVKELEVVGTIINLVDIPTGMETVSIERSEEKIYIMASEETVSGIIFNSETVYPLRIDRQKLVNALIPYTDEEETYKVTSINRYPF